VRQLNLRRSTRAILAVCLLRCSEVWAQSDVQVHAATALSAEYVSACYPPGGTQLPHEILVPHTVGCEKWDCQLGAPGPPPEWRVLVGSDWSAREILYQLRS
jgi:hypothetical protein